MFNVLRHIHIISSWPILAPLTLLWKRCLIWHVGILVYYGILFGLVEILLISFIKARDLLGFMVMDQVGIFYQVKKIISGDGHMGNGS